MAYLTAVLPKLKRFPSFRQFVGSAGSAPRADQTPEEMERVLDHWALTMRSAEVRQQVLGAAPA